MFGPDADDVTKALTGVDFPAHRAELLRAAESNNAPPAVRRVLRSLPDRSYEGPDQVAAATRVPPATAPTRRRAHADSENARGPAIGEKQERHPAHERITTESRAEGPI